MRITKTLSCLLLAGLLLSLTSACGRKAPPLVSSIAASVALASVAPLAPLAKTGA